MMRTRRRLCVCAGAAGAGLLTARVLHPAPREPSRRWYEAAVAMQRLAESWGDQPYGAVLVAGDAIIG
jgi:hypothetical protein